MLLSLAWLATFDDPALEGLDSGDWRCRQDVAEEVSYTIQDGLLTFSGDGPGAACLAARGSRTTQAPDGTGTTVLQPITDDERTAYQDEELKKELVEKSTLLVALIGTTGSSGTVEDVFADDVFADDADLEAALAGVAVDDVRPLGDEPPAGGAVARNYTVGHTTTSDDEAVDKVMRRYTGQIKYCAEAVLPESDQNVTVGLTVREGRVTEVTTEAQGEFASCASKKMRNWRFPPGTEGAFEVTWTVTEG